MSRFALSQLSSCSALVARPAEVLDRRGRARDPVDLLPGRLPTSPIQISFVPGRNAKRNGLRRPYAMIRRAFGSGCRTERVVREPGSGRRIDANDRPVERHRAPDGRRGSGAERSALGRRRRERSPDAARRVSARVRRRSVLTPVDEREARAVTPACVQRAVRAEGEDRRSSGSDTAGTSPRRAPARARSTTSPCAWKRRGGCSTTQPSDVGPGGVGQGSDVAPGVPQRGGGLAPQLGGRRSRGRRRTDASRKVRVRARGRAARDPRSCRRSSGGRRTSSVSCR